MKQKLKFLFFALLNMKYRIQMLAENFHYLEDSKYLEKDMNKTQNQCKNNEEKLQREIKKYIDLNFVYNLNKIITVEEFIEEIKISNPQSIPKFEYFDNIKKEIQEKKEELLILENLIKQNFVAVGELNSLYFTYKRNPSADNATELTTEWTTRYNEYHKSKYYYNKIDNELEEISIWFIN